MHAIWPGLVGVSHACRTPGWPAATCGRATKLADAGRAGAAAGPAPPGPEALASAPVAALPAAAAAAVAAGAVRAEAPRLSRPATTTALSSRIRPVVAARRPDPVPGMVPLP